MPSRPAARLCAAFAAIVAVSVARPASAADSPLLTSRGRPNGWFWITGGTVALADEPLYRAFRRLDSPATHRAAVAANHLGDGRVQVGLFALLTLAGNANDRAIARRGLHGAVAGGLLVAALKETTRKARPYVGRGPVYGARPLPAAGEQGPERSVLQRVLSEDEEDATKPDAVKSFPSGHTMAAFSLATVWAGRRPDDRELAYGLAALVGLARIELKQHWPSDVFFGAAIGIAAGNAANRGGVPFGLMFRL
jgi:undecaprenyl-diphosphatase